MSYRDSAKNRKIKRSILKAISIVRLSWLNLNTAQKTSFFWVLIGVLSLFLNWVDSVEWLVVWNAFTDVLWISWYILIILQILTLLILFSNNNTIIIKNILNVQVKDGFLVLIFSIFSFLITINTFYIVEWLSAFSQWIFLWKWIIFSIISSILSITWWILMIRSKEKISVFSWNENNDTEISEEKAIVDEKNNMKLPF